MFNPKPFLEHRIPVAVLILCACLCMLLPGCDSRVAFQMNPEALAKELEESLFQYILDPWYPLVIDTSYGGYISNYHHDWSPVAGPKDKALVQQARHLWTTSRIAALYPEMDPFRAYSKQGFAFIRDHFWDHEFGGFHYAVREDGSRDANRTRDKQTYGQAFAIYGLSRYFGMSRDTAARDLAMKGFLWLETHCHDPVHQGYFDLLHPDGSPKLPGTGELPIGDELPSVGLKDYNSSIHILEAFTELYAVFPDPLVRERLEEMFILVRDTFVDPEGYERLYFYPDWRLVPDSVMESRSPDNYWYTQHLSFCHDVEVAYLLLESAHVLGWEGDERTRSVAKRLVDHALEFGWDQQKGGFYYAGKRIGGEVEIIDQRKSWWGQAEGLNALVLMYSLYPEDPRDYYGKALAMWDYIDANLVDKEYGGWFDFGLDHSPESASARKSHWWKATYHTVRGLTSAIQILKQ